MILDVYCYNRDEDSTTNFFSSNHTACNTSKSAQQIWMKIGTDIAYGTEDTHVIQMYSRNSIYMRRLNLGMKIQIRTTFYDT